MFIFAFNFVNIKFGSMRYLYLFILYCLFFTGTCFAAIPKAEVISDGDRGLALEFLVTSEESMYKTICVDSASYVYVGGRYDKTFNLKDTAIKYNLFRHKCLHCQVRCRRKHLMGKTDKDKWMGRDKEILCWRHYDTLCMDFMLGGR